MFVGVLKLTFHIPHARSLKEKRMVVRKFRDRVRARFDVSIAEVASQDVHQTAVFGIAVVSGDAGTCDALLESVARSAEVQEDAVLTHRETELMTIGDDLYGADDDG